jgi:hypothetical protein
LDIEESFSRSSAQGARGRSAAALAHEIGE